MSLGNSPDCSPSLSCLGLASAPSPDAEPMPPPSLDHVLPRQGCDRCAAELNDKAQTGCSSLARRASRPIP